MGLAARIDHPQAPSTAADDTGRTWDARRRVKVDHFSSGARRRGDRDSRVLFAILDALDARAEIRGSWRGAALDRVLDEGHARLSAAVIGQLRRWAWEVEVEVSFSHFGERGSIDILAWHEPTKTLLIVEIKTELGSVEGLSRPLDVKVRLAPATASQRFGWKPDRVGRLVVFADEMTNRRQVHRHGQLLDAALPTRSRAVRTWLRAPSGPLAGIWFLTDSRPVRATRNPSSIQRVRSASTSPASARTSVRSS